MDDSWISALRRTNLNQLVSFSAVAERGSFRGAAARLHISQSALSVQIQQLEATLGVKLLHRDTRSVRLTQEGERLQQTFRLSGRVLSRVLSSLRDEGRLEKGGVSVATLPSIASTFMPQMMRGFQALHPGVTIQLQDTDSRRAHEQVIQGTIDMAVTSRGSHNVEFRPLFTEDLLAVVSASDPLFAGRTSATAAQLARRPLLLNPRGIDLRERLEEIFQRAGVAINCAQEMTGTPPLVAMTALGVGVCVLPRSALYALNLNACRLLTFKPSSVREIGVILPPDRSSSPAATAFHDYLLHHAEEVTWPPLPTEPT